MLRHAASAFAFLLIAASVAHATQLLECRGEREVMGDGRVVQAVVRHVVTVDEFKDIVVFDDTVLGLRVMDQTSISAWALATGPHGEDHIALFIDRLSGAFRYSVGPENQPRFGRRVEGVCGPARYAPQF